MTHPALDPSSTGTARATEDHRARSWAAASAKELCLVAALYGLYKVGRILASDQEPLARAHARMIHGVERHLPLPSATALQEWCSEGVLQLANSYYVYAHFPVTVAFLVAGFVLRPRAEYVWARNLLTVQTFLALILHILIPLAPPRMFPQWGFRDTMVSIGPSAYEGASAAVANQFAAMPSLHVGWAVLVAVVVARTGSRPLGVLAVFHAILTYAVVIVTANHWWIDGLVAIALLGVGLALFPGPRHSGPQGRLRWLTKQRTKESLSHVPAARYGSVVPERSQPVALGDCLEDRGPDAAD